MNAEKIVADYVGIWNETYAPARRKMIEDVFADGGTYVDPMASFTGHDEIDAGIAGVQEAFPGLVFTFGPVDAHHDVARFNWFLGPEDGEAIVVGFDVITMTEDGRVASVVGFLDKVPAL